MNGNGKKLRLNQIQPFYFRNPTIKPTRQLIITLIKCYCSHILIFKLTYQNLFSHPTNLIQTPPHIFPQMQPQQSSHQRPYPPNNQQPFQDRTKSHNDQAYRMSNQQQPTIQNTNNNRNSYQGRPSNESYLSFGRMSIEEPFFAENQKISLESNISGKAQEKFQQKDLFENLADCERSFFHQDLFIRDEGSYKQYQIEQKHSNPGQIHQVHYPIFAGNSSNNFGFNLDPHNHFSSPHTLNINSQQFKQRSSQGNSHSNPPTYSGLHSPHNQSQSTIKTKLFDSYEPQNNVQNSKSPNAKIQQPLPQKQPEQKVISCKCPRSKCLLMYCECFSKGIMCNSTCSCYQCRNNPDFEEKRQNARRIVLERDPNAFSNKLQVVGGQQSSQLAYKRGCNCKKTNCFKKYCECFYAGVKCTYLCKCENCMNGGQNAYKG